MQEHYTENFVQSTLSAMGDKLKGCSLVVGGDGRFYGKEATVKIIKICAGNGVSWSYFHLLGLECAEKQRSVEITRAAQGPCSLNR